MKKIIELSTVRNKGREWEIEMVTSNNGYAAEFWRRGNSNAVEENSLWREVRNFVWIYKNNYNALAYFLKQKGFEPEYKECTVYPTYWEADMRDIDPLDYYVYAGKTVKRGDLG